MIPLITVAQLPYKSRVTKTIEYRPVCISLMGSRGRSRRARRSLPDRALTCIILGSDLALLRLVEEALRPTGWRTHVETGRYTFPVGHDGRHVKDEEGGRDHDDAAPTKLHGSDDAAGMGEEGEGEEEEPLDEL